MSTIDDTDYGPLADLIGVWKGDNGLDIAPEPDGPENNPYYETLTLTGIGDVTNANYQKLAVVHYRQIVQRKSNDEVFHDETGYWMWDAESETIMQSLLIPRGVGVLAGGEHSGKKEDDGSFILRVSADINNKDWQVIQSPFMQSNARTTEFHHWIKVKDDKLSYSETTIVEIYGKIFEHTDSNDLFRQ